MRLNRDDLLFCVLAVATCCGVTALGWIAVRDAERLESLKSRGEALVAWIAKQRQSHQMGLKGACDGRTWADCATVLPDAARPVPPVGFARGCGSELPDGRASLVVERGSVPLTPGAPPAYARLAPTDSMTPGMELRILACDKGGYPVVVGEGTL